MPSPIRNALRRRAGRILAACACFAGIARGQLPAGFNYKVLADGFEYLGERYRSLTAVAKAVTGSHMNGFRFFGLEAKP